MYVKMPLMCFFLPLLESPSAPYNHKASSYPRSLAADLLINNFMGKRRNTRSSWCLPENQGKESIKLYWWPTDFWSLCLSFLLCVWNVVVLTLSPQPGVPLAPSWALFAALKSRTYHFVYIFVYPLWTFSRVWAKKEKYWLLPHLRLSWVVFFL